MVEADSEIPMETITCRDFERADSLYQIGAEELRENPHANLPAEIDPSISFWIQFREWQEEFRNEPKKPSPKMSNDLVVPWNLMEEV